MNHDLLRTLSHSREIHRFDGTVEPPNVAILSAQSRNTKKKVASDYCMTEVHCGSSTDIGTYSDIILENLIVNTHDGHIMLT